MHWFIQGIGFIGLVLSLISFLYKKHGSIVLIKMGSETAFALQYILMGAYTGAAMDMISGFRNFLYYRLVKKKIPTYPLMLLCCALVLGLGIYTYDGIYSLLPVGAKLLTTVSYGMRREKLLRLITLPSCFMWIWYNVLVGSVAAVIADALTLVTLSIAIYRYDIKKF